MFNQWLCLCARASGVWLNFRQRLSTLDLTIGQTIQCCFLGREQYYMVIAKCIDIFWFVYKILSINQKKRNKITRFYLLSAANILDKYLYILLSEQHCIKNINSIAVREFSSTMLMLARTHHYPPALIKIPIKLRKEALLNSSLSICIGKSQCAGGVRPRRHTTYSSANNMVRTCTNTKK